MEIRTLDDAPFGARVGNFDCVTADAAAIDALRAALHRHQLLVFPRQQRLTPRQEVEFYRALDVDGSSVWRDQVNNPWEVFKVEQGNLAGTYQIPDEPGVLVLGKGEIEHFGLRVTLGGERAAYGKDAGSQVLGGGALQWHIDGAFYGHAPCHYTQMRCIEAPRGGGHWLDYGDGARLWCAAGATAFASGRNAFERLDAATRELALRSRVHYLSRPFETTYAFDNSPSGLRAVDADAEAAFARGEDQAGGPVADAAAQVYPLVWSDPLTGQQALMAQPRCLHALEIPARTASRFLGVVESRLVIEKWMRPAIDPELVYVHAWRPGDLVIWNNRSVWHSATGRLPRDARRVMHLTAFNGGHPPVCDID